MEFLPFPKITTELDKSPSGNSGGIWIAQEKIHGAQLVIAVGPNGIKFGKRKAWLGNQEAFFGWQLIRVELESLCARIFESLSFPVGTVAYFYGELFGGQYPHTSVTQMQGIQPVQTGIWYAPFIHWAAFDAVIFPAGSAADAYFLGGKELSQSIKEAGGINPPIIARGSFNELMQSPFRFQTKVPSLFGLPEIKNNWAEGLVIKPETSVLTSKRSVLKRKIEEFDEKRFDQSEAWDSDKLLSFEVVNIYAAKMVNPARIDSARSKVGDGRTKELLEEIVLDILIDLEATFPATFRLMDSEQETILKDRIYSLAQNEISK